MRIRYVIAAAGLLGFAGPAERVPAQVRASEAATISQTVDGTVMTIAYSRPQARGRDSLFGRVVHLGETWTPGANWATTLDVNKDVRVNGHSLPAGTYSVWMIPRPDEWTVIVDPQARRFHTQRPTESDRQIRFAVKPDSGAHVEVLTWSFPIVRRDGAVARLQWGSATVALDIAVQPTRRPRLAGSVAAYLGAYTLTFSGPEGESPPLNATVLERDGGLYVRITPVFDATIDPDAALYPIGEHTFRIAFQKDGQDFDVETDAKLIFRMNGGKATGFDMLGVDDAPWGRAVRVP